MDYEKEINELKERIRVLEELLNCKQPHEQVSAEVLSRDKTKYIYNGKILPKNRLVLFIVKDYVQNQKPTSVELFKAFDKTLQGSLGVVVKLEDAQKISDASKRYFMKDDEIITLKDNTQVVVCTQWGAFNINRFIKQSQNLGFVIEQI